MLGFYYGKLHSRQRRVAQMLHIWVIEAFRISAIRNFRILWEVTQQAEKGCSDAAHLGCYFIYLFF